MFEDEKLRDEPRSNITYPNLLDYVYTRNLDETYDVVHSWRKIMDNFVEKHHTNEKPLLIEAHFPLQKSMEYFNVGGEPFNFDFVHMLNETSIAVHFKQSIENWLKALPNGEGSSTPWVIGNHKFRRVASRFGKDGNRADQITMLAMVLPGMAVVYNGDEIGMVDTPLTYERTLDPQGCNAGREAWLPVNGNYRNLNLASQKLVDTSHYKVFKALSSLKKSPVLQKRSVQVSLASDNVPAVIRRLEDPEIIISLINFNEATINVNARSNIKIPEILKVHTASVNSGIVIGSLINTTSLVMPGAASVVLTQ
ncbi:hypothetical protein QAD02_005716 [Eretmocerus hayati]|uniref:Uncharacterized protein n=1 Tax=Eretmocerus hayati TaxID=131215 RepID=A0ACC2NT80_9HYME|nr:hypothetical protein QAD02_005716 [Eretmocerus hayati]